jgi:uncharacterized protein YlxP (DUF503 family)
MKTGSLQVRLLVREARSLKDKRQIVQSIKERLRNQFNVSVAEVDALDHRQMIVLGFAVAAAETSQVRSTLNAIVDALRSHPVAEFISHEMDI